MQTENKTSEGFETAPGAALVDYLGARQKENDGQILSIGHPAPGCYPTLLRANQDNLEAGIAQTGRLGLPDFLIVARKSLHVNPCVSNPNFMREIPMDAKFFVGGLPYGLMDPQLHDMFASCGEVKSAQVIVDKLTGKSRGFGFVEMSTIEEAQNAISVWNDRVYEGRPSFVTLLVNETTIRTEENSRPATRLDLDNA